jgi:predicted Rossmann fold flavoprotein
MTLIEQTMDVCIVGAGPAGLMAAWAAARAGASVVLVEANPVAGRKLLLTGGGRCNITHDIEPQEMVHALGPMGDFLRHALLTYPPSAILEFLHQRHVPTRTEEDGCVFPLRQEATEVRDTLVEALHACGVHFQYQCKVQGLRRDRDAFEIRDTRHTLWARTVILATGGVSYPETGSTGDGYRWAAGLGHDIVPPRPALVPLVTQETWPGELAGMTLDPVTITMDVQGCHESITGPLLFTDGGIGGPVVFNTSRFITDYLPNTENPVLLSIDLLPGAPAEVLQNRLIELCEHHPRKTVVNALSSFIPRRLAAVLVKQCGCADDLWVCNLKRKTRTILVKNLKSLILSIEDTRPLEVATVTRGGVSTDQIHPETMESTLCPGLYFAGEIINVDGPCGGYNLQICWSTGALAGHAAASRILEDG